jgi:hypothetical protein
VFLQVLRQELLDSKESSARSAHLNAAVKDKLARDREQLEARQKRSEAEIERLSRELEDRGRESIEENREQEGMLERFAEEKKRLLVSAIIAADTLHFCGIF